MNYERDLYRKQELVLDSVSVKLSLSCPLDYKPDELPACLSAVSVQSRHAGVSIFIHNISLGRPYLASPESPCLCGTFHLPAVLNEAMYLNTTCWLRKRLKLLGQSEQGLWIPLLKVNISSPPPPPPSSWGCFFLSLQNSLVLFKISFRNIIQTKIQWPLALSPDA